MRKIILTIFFAMIAAPAFAGPKYISLAPSTTEILFALGLDREIIGVSSYCNYPAQAASRRNLGSFSSPSIETIIALKPDYVFCTGLEQDQTVAELRRLGLRIYVADPADINGLFRTVLEIGMITARQREAEGLVARMKVEIGDIASKVEKIPLEKRAKVFLEISGQPLMTAGAGSFVDDLLSVAGGVNVARDVVRPYCNISPEKVISLNPDCIIMAYMSPESAEKIIAGRFGWNNIPAVKNRRVYNDINPDILLRPGPRITEGIRELYKRFYPARINGD